MVEPLSQADLLRDEIDILYTISSKLTHAATPSEWLEAVSVYARERGASSGMLSWINSSRSDDPYFEVIAQWVRDSHSTGGPVARFQLSDFSMWLDQWVANTNQPVLIRDVMDNSGQDIL